MLDGKIVHGETKRSVSALITDFVICFRLTRPIFGRGETLREAVFPGDNRKHKLYFGLFVLLKLKSIISFRNYSRISIQALEAFSLLALDVRINV